MAAYSQDLRRRVVDAVLREEGSIRQVAERFAVSLSFVVRLLQLYRRTGSVEPRPHGGGRRPALGPDDLKRLAESVGERPDATLEELRDRLGVDCSTMAVFRALARSGITRKKKVARARERDAPEARRKRRAFRRKLRDVDADRLVFVDEAGAHTAMTRAYGRAPVGERVEGVVPGRWESVTLICGVRLSGVAAPLAFPGGVDGAAFHQYVEEVLAPELHPGDVVVWDDLKPHQAEEVVKAVERAGAEVVPPPPRSPDPSPIEEMFSKVKAALRSAAARTTEAIYAALHSALQDVTRADIKGWFHDRAAYVFQ